MVRIFKATYKDRALNHRSEKYPAFSWAEAVAKAYERKKAEETLTTIKFVEEVE